MDSSDELVLYDQACASRLLLGTAGYPSPQTLLDAIVASGTGIITVSVRRESSSADGGRAFRGLLGQAGTRLLPNTAGCCTVKEAVNTARMARELFGTSWIKLEVIADHHTLQPDVFGLVEAARILCDDGFEVFPYTTDDLVVADRLLSAGCRVLMPWGAPIGSGRGLNDPYALGALRAAYPDVPMIIDAGLGQPSHACEALQMGMDAVLLNTAVARAGDPAGMAGAFAQAVMAGRGAYRAGAILARDLATPSSPLEGTPFSTPS